MVSPSKSFTPVNRPSKARARGATAGGSGAGDLVPKNQPAESAQSQNRDISKKKPAPRRSRPAPTPASSEPEAGPSRARGVSAAVPQPVIALASSETATATDTTSSRKKGKAQDREYTHIPPTEEEKSRNGRQEGRSLISWKQPRMFEQLVLHIVYEAYRHSIDLPWNHIAHRLHPGSTPGALHQAFARLRVQLIAEGHMVPPPIPKPGQKAQCDSKVRGQVRADEHGDPFEVRNVSYTEKLPQRKFNLPDAVDALQSFGNASSRIKTLAEISTSAGAASASPASQRPSRKRGAAAADVAGGSSGSPKRVKLEEEQDDIDPFLLDGDDEYRPSASRKTKSRRAAATKATQVIAQSVEISDGEDSEQDAEGEVVHADDEPMYAMSTTHQEYHHGNQEQDDDDEHDAQEAEYDDDDDDDEVDDDGEDTEEMYAEQYDEYDDQNNDDDGDDDGNGHQLASAQFPSMFSAEDPVHGGGSFQSASSI